MQRLRALGVHSSGRCHRVIADDDIVVIHAEFPGHSPAGDFTGFEILRLAGGRVAERWLALQPLSDCVPFTDATGRAEHVQQTRLSRRLVDYYTDHVLIGGDLPHIGRFIVTDLVQHMPTLGNGVAPLCTALANRLMCYHRRLLTVAEGEFVLTVCIGGVHDEPAVFYDLYRLDGAMIVEHWSVTTAVPANLPWSAIQGPVRATGAHGGKPSDHAVTASRPHW
ncbi:hypothetical protein [Catellatospora tritici]|uniref:hypothetical protein n=1 Tax=Catellatospora tritici TaxID=2851566 RepID=UPI001C2DA1E8|nr:hypothetical protein [Catellatospora tritici]MBV1854427.1 hypothetical protein [Catellatospora tritici]